MKIKLSEVIRELLKNQETIAFILKRNSLVIKALQDDLNQLAVLVCRIVTEKGK